MLTRSVLTLMIPVPLILFGLGAAFFIEYQKHQAGAATFGGAQLSPVQYVKLRVDTFRHRSEAQAAVAKIDIRDSLPGPTDGWSRTAYEVAHGEQITGVAFDPSAVVKDTEKLIQDDFGSVKQDQKHAAAASYVNGDQIVAVKIRAIPILDSLALDGKAAKPLSEQTVGFNDDTEPATVFTVAGNIEFKQLPQVSTHIASQEVRSVSYRRFKGSIGTQLSVVVFTNASDAAVLDVLHGIDYAALREFAEVSEAVARRTDPQLDGINAAAEEVRIAANDAYRDAIEDIQAAALEAGDAQAAAQQAARIIAEASAEIEATLAEPVQAETVQNLSFRDRLLGLFGREPSDNAKDRVPLKTVCTNSQGFKHCSIVEE